MAKRQSYSNHVRYFPLFHFVIFPLLAINFLCHLGRLFMEPSWERGFWTLLSVVFILMILAARVQALTAQDRVIRLEEKLRYKTVLLSDLAVKAEGLSIGQIIALRFASDAELPSLVQRTLNAEFGKPKEIKQAIKDWRGDHLRV